MFTKKIEKPKQTLRLQHKEFAFSWEFGAMYFLLSNFRKVVTPPKKNIHTHTPRVNCTNAFLIKKMQNIAIY
jgi:hypothetical protein